MSVATSGRRVPDQTAAEVNEQIHRVTKASIDYHGHHPERIDQRLKELDAEWDIERMLQTNAATLAFTGVLLGLLGGRRWLLLSALVTGFLFQHGLQGWCPPMPILRRLGFRTPREIEAERYALKALRGDFNDVQADAKGAEKAARATGRLDGHA